MVEIIKNIVVPTSSPPLDHGLNLRYLSSMSDFDNDQPLELPIDGTLDLHNFNPKDIRKFVDGLAEATGKELRKAGLVAK